MIPSIPGFGFSGPTSEAGWDATGRAAWAELMHRLGYERYGAHGNDAGAIISPILGGIDPEHVVGVHVNQIFSFPSGDPAEFEGLSERDFAALQFAQSFMERAIHDSSRRASRRRSPTRSPTPRPDSSRGSCNCSRDSNPT